MNFKYTNNKFHVFVLLLCLVIFSKSSYCTSSYIIGPRYSDDGYYHMIWMLRETENADTNHSLSYAKSKDLKHWSVCNKELVTAPIGINSNFIIENGIDYETKEFKGLLNNRQKLSILTDGTIVVTYLMNDKHGMQIFNAIKEPNSCDWTIKKMTNWCSGRTNFGRGSIPMLGLPNFSNVREQYNGGFRQLSQAFTPSSHECEESNPDEGEWELGRNFDLKSKISKKNISKKFPELKSNAPLLVVPLNTYQQGGNRKKAIQWFAKENSRDLSPSCYPLFCDTEDFFSDLYLLELINDEWNYNKLKTKQNFDLKVWGGAQSKFVFGHIEDTDYIAYYSKNQCLTLGVIESDFTVQEHCLEKLLNEWDSHNYITSTVLDKSSLFIAGNMHNSELSLYKIDLKDMTVINYNVIKKYDFTYPKFIRLRNKILLMLRAGKSGDGEHILFEILDDGRIIEYVKLFMF